MSEDNVLTISAAVIGGVAIVGVSVFLSIASVNGKCDRCVRATTVAGCNDSHTTDEVAACLERVCGGVCQAD